MNFEGMTFIGLVLAVIVGVGVLAGVVGILCDAERVLVWLRYASLLRHDCSLGNDRHRSCGGVHGEVWLVGEAEEEGESVDDGFMYDDGLKLDSFMEKCDFVGEVVGSEGSTSTSVSSAM